MDSLSSYLPIDDWSDRQTTRNKRGYVLVDVPEHPCRSRGNWVCEHRLVVERQLQRVLHLGETVHHINEIKHDNRLINLFVCWRSEHNKAHDLAHVV